MKNQNLLGPLLLLWLLSDQNVYAQFSSGNQFFIGVNTTVSIDGLTFTPKSFNATWSNKVLTRSEVPIAGKPTSSINRVYYFNEPIGSPGIIGITYDPSELNGNTEDLLQIAYLDSEKKYHTTTGSTVDKEAHFVSREFTGIGNSFLKITAVDANSTLPVTLVSFNATKEGQQAQLTWRTSDEINSDYFEVQYSLNGNEWKPLGQVKAAGDSKVPRTYLFTDEQPYPAQNLYRLKMVDLDGTFAYSKIVNLDFSSSEVMISAYPNPVIDKTTVKAGGVSSIKEIGFTNMAGQSIQASLLSTDQQMQTQEYNLSGFPSGIYIMKTTLSDGTSSSTKIIKK